MADYPNANYSPRTKENKPGVVYTPSKTTIGYAEDISKLDAEVVAIETELGLNPKGTSASILERIKGIKSLSDAIADLIIIKGGKVGFGTSDPSQELHVVGNSLISGISYLGDTTKKPLTSSVATQTIYVDGTNGNDTTGDGSSSLPYATIQKAIDVLPRFITEDTIIAINSGTYTLLSAISFKGVTVTASLTIESRDTSGNALHDYGTATGGTATTLKDTTKVWETNIFAGSYMFINQGTGAGEIRTITSNTATELTISSGTVPDTTTDYVIVGVTIDGNGMTQSLHDLPANLKIKGFRWINSNYAIITYPDNSKNSQRFGLVIDQNLFDNGSVGIFLAGFEVTLWRNLFRVSSIGAYIVQLSYVSAPWNCFIASSSGSGTGLYISRSSHARLYSSAAASTFINLSIGVKAENGSFIESGSGSIFSGNTTDYTPTTSGSPDYSVVK